MADTLEIFGVEYTNVAGIIATDDNGNELTYTRGGGSVTVTDEANATGTTCVIVSGGTGSKQETTGTVTGDGTNVLQIPCSFEPQEIYIRGDLTGDALLRGVVSFTIIKDKLLAATNDSSTSSTQENAWATKPISGYNEENSSTEAYASYSNGILTINTVINSNGARWASGISYSYDLIAYEQGGDTPSESIPLNTELIDFTKFTEDYAIDSSGEAVAAQYYCASDYTAVDPNMTFSYTGCTWYYIGVYNSSKEVIRTIYIYNDGTQDPDNSNLANGTLSGSKLTGASYVRITGVAVQNQYRLSLIRTA